MSDFRHDTVLLEAAVEYLLPETGGLFVDCTVGGGGHAEAILAADDQTRLIGIDRDPAAVAAARHRLDVFGDRVRIITGNFRYLAEILDDLDLGEVDGVLFDLGVSSHQLDTAERGFTYWDDAPLDMRMGPDAPKSAARLLQESDEDELASILWRYGEERWSRRIAQFIVDYRRDQPIETAEQLVAVVKAAVPAGARRRGPHPARRVFQALRIAVNDELGAIEDGLRDAIKRVKPGGRIVAISFHSLEDRIVKRTFAEQARACVCPPELPECRCRGRARLKIVTRRVEAPSAEEIRRNPRARSARLRVAERVLDTKETE